METSSRVTGALLGLAVGDALGAPVEFMSPSQIQIRHGTVREMLGGGWLLLRAGEGTEETALALALAESLVAKGGLDPDDAAARYVEWYRRSAKEASGVLRASLAMLAEGVPAADAAARAREISREEGDGNGALVRAVPLALRFVDRRELAEAAWREAGITHGSERARAASAALAVVLSFLLEGLPSRAAFEGAFDFLETAPAGIPNVLPDVPARPERDLRTTSDAVDTLELALWHVLRGRSFEEVLVRVVNLGGDADNAAAVAGALAGAAAGEGAIPKRWIRGLAARGPVREAARGLAAARGASASS